MCSEESPDGAVQTFVIGQPNIQQSSVGDSGWFNVSVSDDFDELFGTFLTGTGGGGDGSTQLRLSLSPLLGLNGSIYMKDVLPQIAISEEACALARSLNVDHTNARGFCLADWRLVFVLSMAIVW